jgi:hypothetical protein
MAIFQKWVEETRGRIHASAYISVRVRHKCPEYTAPTCQVSVDARELKLAPQLVHCVSRIMLC